MEVQTLILSLVLAVLSGICQCHAIRTWQTNLNYNNTRNWNIGRVPCESDRLVLQNSGSIALELPASTSVRSLVLSSYTEVILPTDGILQITGRQISPKCDGQDAVFKLVKAARWVDADNWDGWSKATPDLERLPCISDQVIFPPDSTYKVIMPDTLYVGLLKINGQMMDTLDWSKYSSEDEGSSQFMTESGDAPTILVSADICVKNQWCDCGNEYLRSQVCKQPCQLPLCKQPVLPEGFCCPLCGSYFLLNLESSSNQELTDHLNTFLKGKPVVWHASKQKKLIQVVLVEEGEYSGEVSTIAEALKASLSASNKGWKLMEFHKSGYVWYPTTFGQVIGHFFSIMIFVVLFLASIIVFYSYDWSRLPLSPLENRPFVFARFENQSEQVMVASEVNEEHHLEPPVTQAFDNPLYGSTNQEQRSVAVTTKEREVTVENPVYTELNETALNEMIEEGVSSDSTKLVEL